MIIIEENCDPPPKGFLDYRKHFFPPARSCPVDAKLLEDQRLTLIQKKDGKEVKQFDERRKAKWKDLQLGYAWRGRTIFSRMRSEGFPFMVGGLGVGAVFAWLASSRRLSSSLVVSRRLSSFVVVCRRRLRLKFAAVVGRFCK